MSIFGQAEAMLIERAASKLAKSQSDLVASARFALREAGSWKDEVHVDVHMNKPYRGTRCARLLHGVPSPRYWATSFATMVRMPAKDVLYFFAPGQLGDCIPDLHSEEDLAQWLTEFSSTRFEDQLIQAWLNTLVRSRAGILSQGLRLRLRLRQALRLTGTRGLQGSDL